MTAESLDARIAKIKLVLVDVDGVLTDGRIVLGDYGDELKFFDSQDGLGLTLLHEAGLRTVIISAKKSPINQRRARDLKITKVYQKAHDKKKVYEKVLRKFRLKDEEACFVGDDLLDLPVMRRVGLAVAVENAVQDVKAHAHYVTQKKGGRGAVREVADRILKGQGLWAKVTERYFK